MTGAKTSTLRLMCEVLQRADPTGACAQVSQVGTEQPITDYMRDMEAGGMSAFGVIGARVPRSASPAPARSAAYCRCCWSSDHADTISKVISDVRSGFPWMEHGERAQAGLRIRRDRSCSGPGSPPALCYVLRATFGFQAGSKRSVRWRYGRQ